uniref:aminomethyltransferase beta-barrel domain-containing protein n=1 Tax=Marinilabilia sp. TaxID=2021252 RepID=UPI00345D4116
LTDKAYFVKQMDSETNKIIVSKSAPLSTSTLLLSDFHLTPALSSNQKYRVDIRVRGIDKVPSLPGAITICENGLKVDFDEEAWAITPGQSIVFYMKDKVIGGSIIKS